MFRNVVAALNEAQDITLFLGPLAKHFEVSVRILLNILIHAWLAVIASRASHEKFLQLIRS